jgi:hypothetical protein
VESTTSLHAFADIVGYSQLDAAQQAESQDRLVRILDHSLRDAGVLPDWVVQQDQGDARLLTFPTDADVARVLAMMPRRFQDDLHAHNRITVPHARLRVRLSYVLGPAAAGRIGRTGGAAIKVVRLSNDVQFRQAMKTNPDVYVGVIVDDYLYRNCVQQEFRPDLHPEEYVATHVSDPDKGFEADAWMRLVGRSANEAESLIRMASPTIKEAAGPGRRRRPLTNPLVIAALITGCLGLAGTVITVLANQTSPTATHGSSGAGQSGKTGTTPPTPPSGSSVMEYADWRGGVQVYADNLGTASNLAAIPFNEGVQVACYSPNRSSMSSINKFYLIKSGPWKGAYASANEFTNGGPREDASDPALDPHVRPCPSG